MPDEKKTKKSWKTTAAGIAAAVGILATQVANLLDDNPETKLSWEAVVGALAVFGIGWFARDNNVSSEDAGAK